MMKTLDLGRFRRARVWIDALPDAVYPRSRAPVKAVAASRCLHGPTQYAAIELFVPLGARSMYGLIGGQFHTSGGGELVVEVATSSSSERLFADSLASNVDEVRVGLPEEFVPGIWSGVDSARTKLGTITAGNLSIDRAAHGAATSSHAIYSSLVVVMLTIFNHPSNNISDAELIEIISAATS